MKITAKWVSSLEKIFPEKELSAESISEGSALRGERYNVQLAVFLDEGSGAKLNLNISTAGGIAVRPYAVHSVPVMLAVYPWSDDDHLRRTAGLYPDLLMPCGEYFSLIPGQWRSIWMEILIPENAEPGMYNIDAALTDEIEEYSVSASFSLKVIHAVLPKQTLIYTEWFHNDCLATYYGVDVFGEQHWKIIENYIAQCAEYGVNMLFTPILTPPVHTKFGRERPTVQLVDISVSDSGYTFDFSRLDRYIDIALKHGIEYFEFSHLFTQWGAKFAPKVVVRECGEVKRLFGWETGSDSGEYISFLNSFIPELKIHMEKRGLLEKCYFHISDEPQAEHMQEYARAKKTVGPLLDGCNVIDALSDYEFYKKGLIQIPIPPNDRIEEFIAEGVADRWTYYCCAQVDKVSNRMIAMPSARNRILGMQMFKYKIEGFLHWGYNFWYGYQSRRPINPFLCTDAEDTFPSGDAFLVYPGYEYKPLASIRQLVFYEALQDMRALQLLSELSSFEHACGVLESECEQPLTFKEYPRGSEWLLSVREKINGSIEALIAQNAQNTQNEGRTM